jgi:hypothetical protein
MPDAMRLFFSLFSLVELSGLALDFFFLFLFLYSYTWYISINQEISQNYWTGMTLYIEQKTKKSFMLINSI